MKPNISVFNAIMRITCGLAALAWATSRMVRRPNRFSFLFVALLGAMKVAEGIHRYCPVTDVLKQNVSIGGQGHQDHRKNDEDKKKDDEDKKKEKSSSEKEED
ncbi:MAG TPA: DUF2892 domain-containing protein [Bacillales bacterium]|nr:DUF2892 domain-containing protein [Bacillales bacterium]